MHPDPQAHCLSCQPVAAAGRATHNGLGDDSHEMNLAMLSKPDIVILPGVKATEFAAGLANPSECDRLCHGQPIVLVEVGFCFDTRAAAKELGATRSVGSSAPQPWLRGAVLPSAAGAWWLSVHRPGYHAGAHGRASQRRTDW